MFANFPLLRLWLVSAWCVLAFALWWAPIWGWLLLVSAWARRMTFVWAFAPPLAVVLFEKIAFGSNYAGQILSNRFNGALAFFKIMHGQTRTIDIDLPDPDPIGFLMTPGLWIGLVVGAAFVAGAIWLRRRAEPI